jgi:hypothetical protein
MNRAERVKKEGDAMWERLLNDPNPRPKLRAYVERILREEQAEPLDLNKWLNREEQFRG